MSILSVKGLAAGYGKNTVLQDVSFSVEPGELLGILGENGSGKSTLLRVIAGSVRGRGEILVGEKAESLLSIRELAKQISYVPQKSGISADIEVLEAVLWGFNPDLGLAEKPSIFMQERARQALARVGLSGEAGRGFLTLSEGQKQAVIFARVLAAKRTLLLMDEPESALDFERRYDLLKLLKADVKERGAGALLALHDPQLALSVCDRLLILKNGVIRSELRPREEKSAELERKLRLLYPSLSLAEFTAKEGTRVHVIFREEEQ